jgi:GMP synthase PP-ATPase subunit
LRLWKTLWVMRCEIVDLLDSAATGIFNWVRGINRKVYEVTSNPPWTIERGEGGLTSEHT